MKVTFVKRARKDNLACKKGESYYWWKFRFGLKHYSLTYPKRSQLTTSNFLSQIFDLEDQIGSYSSDSAMLAENDRDEFISTMELVRDECEESLSNMPESLQSSPTGELLQSRIDSMESMIEQMEYTDCELEEVQEEDQYDTKQDYEEAKEEYEKRIEEICTEIREVTYDGE